MAAGIRRQATAAVAVCLAALLLADGAAARALQQAAAPAAAPAPSAMDQIDPDADPASGPASDDMVAFDLAPASTGPIAPPNALPMERSPVENSAQNCLADIGVRGVAKFDEDNREYYDPLRQEMVTRYDKARFVYNKLVDRYPCAPPPAVYPRTRAKQSSREIGAQNRTAS